jgi:hypothetical protein
VIAVAERRRSLQRTVAARDDRVRSPFSAAR